MNPQKPSKPLSIHAFATLTGTDHRTVKRRVIANGIRPVGKAGNYLAYSFDDLQAVMENDDGCAPRRPRPRPTAQEESVISAFESAYEGSFNAFSEALPEALAEALSKAGLAVTQSQADQVVMSLWERLGRAIESALDAEYFDLCGCSMAGEDSMVSLLIADGEYQDAIKLVADRLQNNPNAFHNE